MNRYLQEYFRRSNHGQYLLRRKDQSWLLVQESGQACCGNVNILTAKASAFSFSEFSPIHMIGPEGLLAKSGGQSSLAVTSDDAVCLSFLCGQELYFAQAVPHTLLTQKENWHSCQAVPTPAGREILAGNLIVTDEAILLSWTVQFPGAQSQTGISIKQNGKWRYLTLAQGRGAFAPVILLDAQKNLHAVWAQADERTYYLVVPLDNILNGKPISEPVVLTDEGRQPTLIDCSDGILVVYENHLSYPFSILISDGRVNPKLSICAEDCRFDYTINHSLNLARDPHGVPTVYWAENHRDLAFSARWLGESWGPIQVLPSIYHDSPRSDSIFCQIGRLTAEKYPPADAKDIGLFMEPEIAAVNPVFQRDTFYDLPADNPLLFFDLKEVVRLENLELTVTPGQKSSANPLIPQGPTGSFNSYNAVNRGCFLYTGRGWQGWFTGSSIPGSAMGFEWWTQLRTGYVQSTDGIHWHGSDLKFTSLPDTKNQNVIPDMPSQPFVYFDTQESDLSKKYKMVYFLIAGEKEVAARNSEYDYLEDFIPGWLFTSPDGIHWQKEPISLHCPGGMWFEHCPMCLFRDHDDPDPSRRWKTYGYASLNLGRRVCSLATSADLKEWILEPRPALSPEERGAPWVPSGPWAQVHGMEVAKLGAWYIAAVENQLSAAQYDLELAVSRNGDHFQTVRPGAPLVSRGEQGSWDGGGLMPAGLNCLSDKIMLYYTGKMDHGSHSSIGVATFPTLGLTALQLKQPDKPGMLITANAYLRKGKTYSLYISGNHACVTAEIRLQSNDNAIAGFEYSAGDNIELHGAAEIMTWQGKTNFIAEEERIYCCISIQNSGGNAQLHALELEEKL